MLNDMLTKQASQIKTAADQFRTLMGELDKLAFTPDPVRKVEGMDPLLAVRDYNAPVYKRHRDKPGAVDELLAEAPLHPVAQVANLPSEAQEPPQPAEHGDDSRKSATENKAMGEQGFTWDPRAPFPKSDPEMSQTNLKTTPGTESGAKPQPNIPKTAGWQDYAKSVGAGTLSGAAIGSLVGGLRSDKGEDTRGMLRGALVGGATGAAAGAAAPPLARRAAEAFKKWRVKDLSAKLQKAKEGVLEADKKFRGAKPESPEELLSMGELSRRKSELRDAEYAISELGEMTPLHGATGAALGVTGGGLGAAVTPRAKKEKGMSKGGSFQSTIFKLASEGQIRTLENWWK